MNQYTRFRRGLVDGKTHDSVEQLVDLGSSFVARVLHLGNTAAPGGQHLVANVWRCVAALG
jgi:hypothetical protein